MKRLQGYAIRKKVEENHETKLVKANHCPIDKVCFNYPEQYYSCKYYRGSDLGHRKDDKSYHADIKCGCPNSVSFIKSRE